MGACKSATPQEVLLVFNEGSRGSAKWVKDEKSDFQHLIGWQMNGVYFFISSFGSKIIYSQGLAQITAD